MTPPTKNGRVPGPIGSGKICQSVNPDYFDFSKSVVGVMKLTTHWERVLHVTWRNCALSCVFVWCENSDDERRDTRMCSIARVFPDSEWKTPFGVTWASVVNTSVYNARFTQTYSKLSSSFSMCRRSRLTARDAPLHRVLIGSTRFQQQLSPPFRSWRDLRRVPSAPCWPPFAKPPRRGSRADWDLTNLQGSWREQCRRGRTVRSITAPISCGSRGGTPRPIAWRNPCQSALSPSRCYNKPTAHNIQATTFLQ